MRKELNAWTIYHYLVCFVTLMMIIAGAVQGVNNLVDYFWPPRISWPTLESVERHLGPEADEETIRQHLEQERSEAQQNHQNRSLRNFLRSVIWVGIALPVYLYHWRRISRQNQVVSHAGAAEEET